MTTPTRGFLFFAHNNEEIDYGKLALVAALMIKRNLVNNQVCIVTDSGTYGYLQECYSQELLDQAFDKVIFVERDYREKSNHRIFRDTQYTEKNLSWYNGTRVDAYSISPFDETILLDTDVLVQDSMFDLVWDLEENIIINRDSINLMGKEPAPQEKRLAHCSIPMYWATAIFFRKSLEAERFFYLYQHVKEQYSTYCFIYGFPKGLFRNDFVVSIAVHMMNGFVESGFIKSFPRAEMITSYDTDELVEVGINKLKFLANDQDDKHKYHYVNVGKRTVHCMNKYSLSRQADNLIELYK